MPMSIVLFLLVVVAAAAVAGSAPGTSEPSPRKGFQYQSRGVSWEPRADSPFWTNGLKHGPHQIDDEAWLSFEVFGDPESESSYTQFALAFNTTGWIAFGATDSGSMIGVNPLVVQRTTVDGNEVYKCINTHATDFTTPQPNAVQTCVLLQIDVVGGETYAMIRRPTIGCFPEDITYRKEWELRWAFAWGLPDQHDFVYHSDRRGVVSFNAVHGLYTTCQYPNDTFALDARITTTPWELPAYRDVYFCKSFFFPTDKRYHLVGSEAILFDIAPAVYHHAILYDCPLGLPDPENWEVMAQCPGVGGTAGCTRFWTGWAAGQSQFCSEHGYAIGQGQNTISEAFLEVHIDNPQSSPGIIDDGWGLRLWVTETLTEIEGMIVGLYVGISGDLGIPPLHNSFILSGVCGGECTSIYPDDGIWITSVTPHMHALATRNWVSQIRDGVEIRRVYTQNHWDFNWQGPRLRTEAVQVLPGDLLISHCDFDTSNKTTPTYFGESYSDEMCLFYISYYPATPLTTCSHWPGQELLDGEYEYDQGTSECNAPPWTGNWDISDIVLVDDEPMYCPAPPHQAAPIAT